MKHNPFLFFQEVNKMKATYIVCVIALIAALVVVTPASATTWYVHEGDSIQAAIDSASLGDTVFVWNGTYSGYDICINKPSITVKGEGADVVIFDGEGTRNVWMPRSTGENASGSLFDGFTVVNSPVGIYVAVNGIAQNCIVKSCVFDFNGSTAAECIQIEADNFSFENNAVSNAAGKSVTIKGSNCTLKNNVVLNSTHNYLAVFVKNSNTTIINNTIKGSKGAAISLDGANSENNVVTKNNITSNTYAGIELYNAGSGNKIYLNDFIDNGKTATTTGKPAPAVTYWNSTEPIEYTYGGTTYTNYLGNYWSTAYSGTDGGGDGIGDTSYTVPDSLGSDHRPLMIGFENYPAPAAAEEPDLTPTSLTSTALYVNHPNTLTATIKNNGTADAGAFNVSLKVDETVIDNETVTSLGAGNSTNVAFTWTPTSAGTSNLTVIADFEDAVAESDETNNNLTVQATVQEILFDGTVTLTNGTTFAYVPSNNASASYTVSTTTDLGALTATGLAFNASDEWYASYIPHTFFLESIAGIENEAWPNSTWCIYINDAPASAGLSGNEIEDGDNVKFYFCPANSTTYAYITEKASYLVNITVAIPSVTSLTITPNTGITSKVQAYNIIVNTTGFTSLNVTIPAGFRAKTPSGSGQIARADLWWANEEDPHYGYVTFTANATDKMDVYAHIGGLGMTYPGMPVNYTAGGTTSVKSPFGSHAERANLTLPTESASGCLKISGLPDRITNVTVSIGDFVQNPDSTATYTFTAKSDGEAVGKSATVTIEAPSPCFIATAAYGTSLHEDIDVLRDFRDEYLMTNPVGRAFVKTYYTTSPPIADALREHEGLRVAVREGLIKPLVYITRVFV